MVSITAAEGFDYLDPAAGVFVRLLQSGPTRVTFATRSGGIVAFEGTGLIVRDGGIVSGTVTRLFMSDSAGVQQVAITGFQIAAARLFGYFLDGSALPHLFWGNETFTGTNHADMIDGYIGNDTIYGYEGDDTLGGGPGNDVIVPGTGNDKVYGGDGEDIMVLGGLSSDWAVVETTDGGRATSNVTGETKSFYSIEYVQFDDAGVSVFELPGITATAVDGVTHGTLGADILYGTGGRDFLLGEGGQDILDGGAGDDVYYADDSATIVELPDGGYDHINYYGYAYDYTIPENVESLSVDSDQPYHIIGNALDNTIIGAERNDTLEGGDGNDVLMGAAAQDVLRGMAGDDHLYGGAGNDVIEAGIGDDYAEGGGGSDTINGRAGNDILHGDVPGAEGLVITPTESQASPATAATNILFVTIDDLAPIFSIFPQALQHAVAPNLDSFFAGSTTFVNAFSAVPSCNGSRAAVLFGAGPDTTNVISISDPLIEARAQFQSLPAYLKTLGYNTVNSGKVFHDNASQGDPAAWTITDTSWTKSADWVPTSWHTTVEPFSDALSPDVTDRAFADARAIDFLKNFLSTAGTTPFFYALGEFRPHEPNYAPKAYFDLHPLDSITIPDLTRADLDDIGRIGRAYADQEYPGVIAPPGGGRIDSSYTETEIKLGIQAYLASASYADAVFGLAMAALRNSPYASNTAVVVWGDNGFHLLEKNHFSKFTPWEEGSHIPLAIQLPGQTQGQVVSSVVGAIDIYKTITDLLNVPTPQHVEGSSLGPLLENPALVWSQPVVTNLDGNYSVRTDDYRYVLYWDGSEELYDHRVDPYEHQNLAADPASRAIMDDLRRYLPGGADIIHGGAGDDTIYGEAGNDQLFGDEGQDQLFGGTGNDMLDGGSGSDVMTGGPGDDTYFVDDPSDQVIESPNEGTDLVRTALAHFVLGENLENLTGDAATGQSLEGNALANTITGGAGNDSIDGKDGDDLMKGGAGDDIYYVAQSGDVVVELADGGTDQVVASISYTLPDNVENLTLAVSGLTGIGNGLANTLSGSDGADVLSGMAGDDSLFGGEGDDSLSGGEGNDRLDGGPGSDVMSGGSGDDVYLVDDLGDEVHENPGEGVDEVHTGLATYRLSQDVDNLTGTSDSGQILSGNDAANVVTGGSGNDTLAGFGGNDILDGGLGADRMEGGSGDDIYIVDDPIDVIVEDIDGGIDEARVTAAVYSLGENLEGLTGIFSTGQALTGNDSDNRITGGAGDDTLVALAGNDRLDGGFGADSMSGGLGNDIYYVDNAGDQVIENAGEGTDEVRTALASYTLGANIEKLSGLSAAGQKLTGNALANEIEGANGDDTLDGGAGSDTLKGGLGNDIYLVDSAGDQVIENAGEGTDEVRTALASYTLGANIENLTGLSAASQALTGNTLANIITGSSGNDALSGLDGNDTLDGGLGADSMAGGLGNDVFFVDNAGDQVIESAGQGTDEVRTTLASYTLGANVENLTGLATSGQTLVGNAGDNTIAGGAGNDQINGFDGNDVMKGGAGNDTYYVAQVGDVVIELANEGTADKILAKVSYTLPDNVEILQLQVAGLTGTGNALANSLIGSTGNDTMFGMDGADDLSGGDGNDVLDGGAGNDALWGGNGNDVVNGGSGADRMYGQGGDDIYFVDDVGDVLSEAAGDGIDEVRTTLATYVLQPNFEKLTGLLSTGQVLTGNNLANTIFGGTGNDTLDGGFGADSMAGGLGNDIYYVDNTGDQVIENAGEGTDEVRTALAGYTLGANVENLTGLSVAGQVLTGNALSNLIVGSSGNDTLSGLEGDDTLDGGAGSDTLKGGLGNDIYLVDSAGDQVIENAGEGTDEVRTALASYTLGANVENLTGLSATPQALTGNASANVIIGSTGNDTLSGLDGNDTLDGGLGADSMAGGLGNDVFFVDNAGDQVIESAGQGTDEVRTTLASYTLGANVENLTGLATSGQTLVGNAGDNTIAGGAGNDQINGFDGNDVMKGGAGNDTYYVAQVGDVVIELANEGTADKVLTKVSYTLSDNVEILQLQVAGLTGTGNALANSLIGSTGNDTMFGMDGADDLSGGDGNDVLDGGAGNDALWGGNGNDVLRGGLGKDTYSGGAGADIFAFGEGETSASRADADRIFDFSRTAGDRIDLSAIDANVTFGAPGDQAFNFVGSSAFSSVAGELRFEQAGGYTFIEGDTNGDSLADFSIRLDGVLNPVATDFIL